MIERNQKDRTLHWSDKTPTLHGCTSNERCTVRMSWQRTARSSGRQPHGGPWHLLSKTVQQGLLIRMYLWAALTCSQHRSTFRHILHASYQA